MTNDSKNYQVATFGGGCFWCTEAVFLRLKGVKSVSSGYSNGKTANPTYKEICTGLTGHAEVIKITYDDAIISFKDLLTIFFSTHDPTTLNRQGNDVGTQYRSAIFYHTSTQKEEAESFIQALEEEHVFDQKIVTEVTGASKFYEAEDYHQNYFENNPTQPYCNYMIPPKLSKLEKNFKHLLKAS